MPRKTNKDLPHISHEELLRSYRYDSATGDLYSRNRETGQPAGYVTRYGYREVVVRGGRRYFAHRLVWLYHKGVWPEFQIDHIDGNKLNNRIENLRDVTQTQNMQNMKRPYKNNQTGLQGAYWHRGVGKHYSQIRVNKKLINLGYFPDAESAHAAFMEAKQRFHPGWAGPQKPNTVARTH